MSEHALFSASGSKKWLNCAAALALEHGLPDSESIYARHGTEDHATAETLLLDRSVVMDLSTPEARDRAQCIQSYVDYVNDLREGAQVSFIELRVDYSEAIGQPDSFGTADAVVLRDGVLHVVDLKTGHGYVEAEENPQLMLYAIGALDAVGMAAEINSVTLHIVQPKIDNISFWEVDLERLESFRKIAKEAARHAWTIYTDVMNDTPKSDIELDHFSPSPDACKWCKAAKNNICPALTNIAKEAAQIAGAAAEDFEDIMSDPDQLGRSLDQAPLIESYIKNLYALAAQRTAEGNPPVGKDGPYKFVAGRAGARAWTNAEEAEVRMRRMRLKVDEMFTYKLASPKQLETTLKTSPQRWASLQDLVGQAEGKPKLVPATNKKPAIQVSVTADAFGELEDED